jgi:hypothetical protein
VAERGSEPQVIWKPQPGPQEALIACPVFEVFYGGARGGGKTDGSIGDWLSHSGQYGEDAIGVFFRRTFKQLSEVIARTHTLYSKVGGKWNGERSEWTMPRGGRLLFRYLERDRDAENYQGHNYTRVYFEEVTNFPSPDPIDKLRATLRSAKGVPVGMRLTGNPGGPGHSWVKKRYIDPWPAGYKILTDRFENPFNGEVVELERVFIPAKLSDNKLLMDNQPTYVAQLQQTGSKQLVDAWLRGLWDIIDGAFFAEFDPIKHVLPADFISRVPPHTLTFRAFDWGYAKPFSCGWYAVSDGSWGLPRGAMLKIQEWYGSTGRPNEGMRLDAPLVGQGIRAKDLELEERFHLRVKYGAADPSIFIRDGGPSIAEQMAGVGCIWQRADNKRVPGWAQMHSRLTGLDGVPMLYFLETCDDTIRTIPLLQHDQRNAEDLDTEGEDHAGDETRYACMSRPWVLDAVTERGISFPKLPGQLTFNDVLQMNRRKRLESQGELW